MASVVQVQLGDQSYPILVTPHGFDDLKKALNDLSSKLGKKCAIITHPELIEYARTLQKTVSELHFNSFILEVPSGESSKSFNQVEALLNQIFEQKLDRKDFIIALGGGVIGDLAGFVASIYLRGIPVIQCPTTLLAQVDSSIGGKTGVNNAFGKNLIGSFYQPKLTYSTLSVLETLPQSQWISGLAEVIKYGVIWDKDLFAYIDKHKSTLARFDSQKDATLWQHIIRRSSEIKAEVVSQDEKEGGLRAILNFGHTIGHGIEAAFNYGTFSHGEAVALGMIAAGKMAVSLGMWPQSDQDALESLITYFQFPTHITPRIGDYPTADLVSDIMAKMSMDKKMSQGTFKFILPDRIGHVTIVPITDSQLIQSGIEYIL